MSYNRYYPCGCTPCPCCIPGPPGPPGPPGASPTPVYMFAGNGQGGVDVVDSGTNIPLPDYQVFSAGIVADAASSAFTILIPGVYRLVYHINLEVAENVSTRLTLSGNQVDASVLFPVAPERQFSAEVFLALSPGDVISLQMFNATQFISFPLGIGATLSIVKEN